MCGIFGVISHSPCGDIADSLHMLSHRGPDAWGIESGCSQNRAGGMTHYALGHRRLSIIDLATGAQPLVKKSHIIVLNGEIYNYVELAAELAAKHRVQFATKSDTEVLLEAYLTWGPKCLDFLNGMWAFAIVDLRSGDLFCARDRFGEKPFYYVSQPGQFAFSSEVGPLLGLIPGPRANLDTVTSFILGVPGEPNESFYDGIAQLPAASALSLSSETLQPKVFPTWAMNESLGSGDISYEEACSRVRTLLEDSVTLRLRSDVEVGVAASGGIDSSIIVRNSTSSGRQLTSVSVIYDGTFTNDETPYIKKLAAAFPVQPEYSVVRADLGLEEFIEVSRGAVRILGMPSPYTSVPYVNALYKKTRQRGIKVLLEGQGADELFGGYTFFRAFQPGSLIAGRCSLSDFLISCRFRGAATQRFYMLANTMTPFIEPSLVKPLRRQPHIRGVNMALRDAQRRSILPLLLDYADRLSMRWGVEVRLPFLDHRLVEFVNALPGSYKVLGRVTKRILRDSFAGLLPKWILKRPKVGFGNPTDAVIARHLGTLTKEFIYSGNLAREGVVRLPRGSLGRHLLWKRLPNYQRILWRLLSVELWSQEFSVSI